MPVFLTLRDYSGNVVRHIRTRVTQQSDPPQPGRPPSASQIAEYERSLAAAASFADRLRRASIAAQAAAREEKPPAESTADDDATGPSAATAARTASEPPPPADALAPLASRLPKTLADRREELLGTG